MVGGVVAGRSQPANGRDEGSTGMTTGARKVAMAVAMVGGMAFGAGATSVAAGPPQQTNHLECADAGGAVAAVDRQLAGVRSVAPQRWDGGSGVGSGGGVDQSSAEPARQSRHGIGFLAE